MIIKQLMVKRRYFEEPNLLPIDLHSKEGNTMEVNGEQVWFFKISSFVFSIRKKRIQVWNDMRVSKWWHDLHFWVNYPFKSGLIAW